MAPGTVAEMAGRDRHARAYGEHRDYVLRVLRRRCGWLDDADREGMFHDAFLVLLDKEDRGVLDVSGMAPHQVRAYLAQVALNKALDEGKRAGRQRSVPLADQDIYTDERSAVAEELVDGDADRARVREIIGELPERQQTIVKLRFFFERTPTEIQDFLGISERAYRRDFERAMRTVADGFELLRNGEFCDSRRSLILAYVAGIAGPNRAADARQHLATCRGCAVWAAELRTAGEKVAAVAPLPVIMGAGSGRLAGIGDRVLSVAETVKHHVTNLAVRTDAATPTQFAGARPGAAVAAIAGCLAVGGGVTYCAVEGLPLPPALTQHHAKHEPGKQARKAPKRTAAKPVATRPAAAATPTTITSRPAATTTAKAPVVTAAARAAAKRSARKKAAAAKVARAQKKNAELTFEGSGSTAPPASAGARAAKTSTSSASSGAGGSSGTSSGSSAGGGSSSGKWSSEFSP
jgi:RNA polymerase sigma factor (sigma-70 family)